MKKSDIVLNIELDHNNVPEKINWSASDGGIEQEDAKAFLLSVWDSKHQETLKIDLWTKDMPLNEMKTFFHQTLVALSETYYKATHDEKMSQTMKDFCEYFAEKIEIIK
ncbi:MAG: gliding motility protein GldC [Flavobacterium sp.]|jgi:gliding motility-associated protein GldC